MRNKLFASLARRGLDRARLTSRRVVTVIVAVSVLCVGAYALLNIDTSDLRTLIGRLTECKGSPAPWINQLSLADQQAKKIDSNAILREITLYTLDTLGKDEDPNSCLDLSFKYVSPNGGESEVRIRDTDPPSLVKVDANRGSGSAPTQDELAQYQKVRNMIKIGPREVLSRTYADGLAFSKSLGEDVDIRSITIWLRDALFEPQGKPVWTIAYHTASRDLDIRVSPEDGKIIEKKEVDLGGP